MLLTATLAGAGMLPPGVALGLVLGANVGSGVLGVLATARSDIATRRLPMGNLIFKLAGCAAGRCPGCRRRVRCCSSTCRAVPQQVVAFHLLFNVALAVLFIGFTGLLARWLRAAGWRRRRRSRRRAGRATSTRWRCHAVAGHQPAPRARRCTRPTWWRPCCAA